MQPDVMRNYFHISQLLTISSHVSQCFTNEMLENDEKIYPLTLYSYNCRWTALRSLSHI